MKDLFEYTNNIDTSLQYICEATPEDRAINKWLKQHKCVKIKAVDGELVLSGKSPVVENEFNLLPGEETIPENIKFADWSNSCTLTISGPDIKTVAWAPVSKDDGIFWLQDCNSIEDFDCDYSNFNGRNIVFKNCKKLKSFSGLQKFNGKRPIPISFYDCDSLKSLKQLDGVKYSLSNIKNCPIKNLEGSVTDWVNGYSENLIRELPELESFEGAVFKDPEGREIDKFGAYKCPKLKRLGKVDFAGQKISWITFQYCPSVGREMIQDLIDNVPFDKEDDWGAIIFYECGVDKEKDKDLLDKLAEVSGKEIRI
jgi:hypothetical protein